MNMQKKPFVHSQEPTHNNPYTRTQAHTDTHTPTHTHVNIYHALQLREPQTDLMRSSPPNAPVPGVFACVRNGHTSSKDMVPVTRTHTNSLSCTRMYVNTHTNTHTHTHTHTHIHTHMPLGIQVCLLCLCRECTRKRVCRTCVWVCTIL